MPHRVLRHAHVATPTSARPRPQGERRTTATDWRPDPVVEQMQASHAEDRQRFTRFFGAAGLLRIGLYANDKQRAHATGSGDTAA